MPLDKNSPTDLFQYDSDQVSLTWIDLELTDGLPATSNVITITLDNQQFDYIPDGLGGGIYRRWVNLSGICEIQMQGAHPLNQRLFATHNASVATGVLINGPLFLNDKWNKQRVLMGGALPLGFPQLGRGIPISNNIWTFKFSKFQVVPNLFRRNQIG